MSETPVRCLGERQEGDAMRQNNTVGPVCFLELVGFERPAGIGS